MSLASCRHSNSFTIMWGDLQTKRCWLDLCADRMKPGPPESTEYDRVTVRERRLSGGHTEDRNPLGREAPLTRWRGRGLPAHPHSRLGRHSEASQPFGPALPDVPAWNTDPSFLPMGQMDLGKLQMLQSLLKSKRMGNCCGYKHGGKCRCDLKIKVMTS